MDATRRLTLVLSKEMAAFVSAKVASGEYADEGEVIHSGLMALLTRSQSIDTWLREHVVPAADAVDADPSRALSVQQVKERLQLKRSERTNAG